MAVRSMSAANSRINTTARLRERGLMSDDPKRGELIADIDSRLIASGIVSQSAVDSQIPDVGGKHVRRAASPTAVGSGAVAPKAAAGDNADGAPATPQLDSDLTPEQLEQMDFDFAEQLPRYVTISVIDYDNGAVVRTVRKDTIKDEGELRLEPKDYPACYEQDEDLPAIMRDGDKARAYVRFKLPQREVSELRALAVDTVMGNDVVGDIDHMLSRYVELLAMAVRSRVADDYAVTVVPLKVETSAAKTQAGFRQRLVGLYQFAGREPTRLDTVRRAVVRLLERTDFVRRLAPPALEKVRVNEVEQVASEVTTSAFNETYVRGLVFGINWIRHGFDNE